MVPEKGNIPTIKGPACTKVYPVKEARCPVVIEKMFSLDLLLAKASSKIVWIIFWKEVGLLDGLMPLVLKKSFAPDYKGRQNLEFGFSKSIPNGLWMCEPGRVPRADC